MFPPSLAPANDLTLPSVLCDGPWPLAGPQGEPGVTVLVGDLRPGTVQAGFQSPAEDHLVQRVDLMAELIKHPQPNPQT